MRLSFRTIWVDYYDYFKNVDNFAVLNRCHSFNCFELSIFGSCVSILVFERLGNSIVSHWMHILRRFICFDKYWIALTIGNGKALRAIDCLFHDLFKWCEFDDSVSMMMKMLMEAFSWWSSNFYTSTILSMVSSESSLTPS